MSASPMPVPFLVSSSPAKQNRVVAMPTPVAVDRSKIVRRRPSQEQGRALETLGHALEYLVDSRMFLSKDPKTRADSEAIHILSRCSREVFATCAEIVPMRQRVKTWVVSHFHLGQLQSAGGTNGGHI